MKVRKTIVLMFTILLAVSIIPFSTTFAHTTAAAPANGQNPEKSGETAENNVQAGTPENAQGTQHAQHSTQETDSAQETNEGQIGGLEIMLLILFTLLIAAPLVFIWWLMARNRPH